MYFINNLLATMIKKNYILGILNQKRRRRWKKGECRSEGVKYSEGGVMRDTTVHRSQANIQLPQSK